MNKDEFKLRRKMAIIAFGAILFIAGYVLHQATHACQDIASNLQAANGILAPIVLCLTSLVGGYGLAVHMRDKEKEND